MSRREVLIQNPDAIDASKLLWFEDLEACEDRARAVRDALRSLTEKQREVVVAYFFEGRSQSDIARQLGVSQQVVHKRIFGVVRDGRRVGGALKRLATILQPWVRS